jgi:bifunctional DNA-binding transcriptional regulator/antitoxin component of YhaV-PrlF toxin-antitoxin module
VLLRPKRQMTIPRAPYDAAGLITGDRLRVHSDGPGRILLERIAPEDRPGAEEQVPV